LHFTDIRSFTQESFDFGLRES